MAWTRPRCATRTRLFSKAGLGGATTSVTQAIPLPAGTYLVGLRGPTWSTVAPTAARPAATFWRSRPAAVTTYYAETRDRDSGRTPSRRSAEGGIVTLAAGDSLTFLLLRPRPTSRRLHKSRSRSTHKPTTVVSSATLRTGSAGAPRATDNRAGEQQVPHSTECGTCWPCQAQPGTSRLQGGVA